MIDTGKRKFTFTSDSAENASIWLRLLSGCLDGEHNPDYITPVFEEVDGERVWVVRGSLKPEETQKLDALYAVVAALALDEKTRQWADDACLCRFLRAREWDVAKAGEMLSVALKWRMEVGLRSQRDPS